MGLFNWFSGLFASNTITDSLTNVVDEPITAMRIVHVDSMDENAVNPATGLPMVGGTGGVDVLGNHYGVDMNDHDMEIGSTSCFDDPFHHDSFSSSNGCGSGDFDNSFGINDSFSSIDNDW